MKKKILCVMLVLTIVLTMSAVFSVSVSAEDQDLSNATIYIAGGKAYMNSLTGTEITAQVENMGLVYDSETSEWKMTGFVFTTGADTAFMFCDTNTTIVVSGTNVITCGTSSTTCNSALICGEYDSTVTIKGAETGTNSLKIDAVESTANGADITAIYFEYSVLTIGNNVTVEAIAGAGKGSSFGVVCSSLVISETGKLIAKSDENSDGSCFLTGIEPDVCVKNTADSTTPIWDMGQNTYMNGSVYAKDITMTTNSSTGDTGMVELLTAMLIVAVLGLFVAVKQKKVLEK